MDKLNALVTNTTSLVGYIALLIVAGSYLGGNPEMQASALKGSVIESGFIAARDVPRHVSTTSAIITIDGRQYRAEIGEEVTGGYTY